MAYIETILRKYPDQLSRFLNSRLKEIEVELKAVTEPLIKEREELLLALKEMEKSNEIKSQSKITFKEFEDSLTRHHANGFNYNPNDSNIDKAIFVLNKNGWLTLNEIANKISELEQGIDFNKTRDTLSAVLRMEVIRDSSRVKRRKNEENKWEYNVA